MRKDRIIFVIAILICTVSTAANIVTVLRSGEESTFLWVVMFVTALIVLLINNRWYLR